MAQMVALVPPGLSVNSSQQLVVVRDNTVGLPIPIIIAPTHPEILTQNGTGEGQGLIYDTRGSPILADGFNPAKPGDTIIIYCTGLGATDQNGNAFNAVTVSIGGLTVPTTYAGVALAQDYPPTGAPQLLGGLASATLGGLYEIIATVPSVAATGVIPVTVSSAGQNSQPGVTLVVAGSTAVSETTTTKRR
jgi:hypothetical protein